MDLSPTYLEHFQAPKNIGDLEEPRTIVEVAHQGGGCHDRLRVSLRITDGNVEDAMWRARACSGTVAAASAATEWVKGKPITEVGAVTVETLIDVLDGIPEKKRHSVELVVQALQKAADTTC
jgi:nitrogen fixation protein NifU and related proteins